MRRDRWWPATKAVGQYPEQMNTTQESERSPEDVYCPFSLFITFPVPVQSLDHGQFDRRISPHPFVPFWGGGILIRLKQIP